MENNDFVMLLEDGIFSVRFKRSVKIDYNLACQLIEARKQLRSNTPGLIILDGNGVTNVSKEARDLFVSEEAIEGVLAGAFIVNSPLTVVLGNFFIKISKPQRPARLFTDKAEAMKWLRTFQNTTEQTTLD